jgi:hypothetical protein
METQSPQAFLTKRRHGTIFSIKKLSKPIRPCFFWEKFSIGQNGDDVFCSLTGRLIGRLYWYVRANKKKLFKKIVSSAAILTSPGLHAMAPKLLVVITLTFFRAVLFLLSVVPSGDPPTVIKLCRRNWWVTFPTPIMLVSIVLVQSAMSCCAKGKHG